MEILTVVFLVTTLIGLGVLALLLYLRQVPSIEPRPASNRDIFLGKVKDSVKMVRLTWAEQLAHISIFGISGSGKSRLLEAIFLQRFNLGRDGAFGTGIIEPHHDLSIDSLTYLVSKGYFQNADAYDRLIYVDWGNGDFVPFNILKKDGRDTYTITKNALDAMIRVWPELTSAPAFQRLFEAAVATLVENNLPITFLHQLIAEKPFRDRCLANVADPLIHQAFASFEELGRDAPMEKASLERRAFALCFSPITRYTLGQPDNVLNFREIIDSGKSFIINLGHIGDLETKKLVGSFLLAALEQAAISRADIDEEDRRPFTLIIDEWPSFLAHGPTLAEILSQCRKYGLFLVMAAQDLAQVDERQLRGGMSNCRIKIAYGLGYESATIQSREIADIDVMAIKEGALTLTQHSQFLSVADQFAMMTGELQRLPPRFAFIKKGHEKAECMQTVTMPRAEVDKAEREQVLATYRSRYQRTKEEAEAAIATIGEKPEVTEGQSAPQAKAGPTHARTYKRATSVSNDRIN